MNLLYDSLIVADRALRMPKPYGKKQGSCSDELIDKLAKIVKV